jgi:translation initiation factor IF-1
MEVPIEVEGVIRTILSNTVFRVELADKNQVLARVSETLHGQFIRFLPGDRVKMRMKPGGLGKPSIVLRLSQA